MEMGIFCHQPPCYASLLVEEEAGDRKMVLWSTYPTFLEMLYLQQLLAN